MSYGQHGNLELLQLYGFLVPYNPHDTVRLPLALVNAACHVPRATALATATTVVTAGLINTSSPSIPAPPHATARSQGVGGKHAATQAPTLYSLFALARAYVLDSEAALAAGLPDLATDSHIQLECSRWGGAIDRLPTWITPQDCYVHVDGAPSWHLLRALR
jgi:hypothetical protein